MSGVQPGQPADPRLSHDRLRFALDVGRTGIWSWEDGREDFVGDRGASLLWGLGDGESISTEALRGSLDPDDAERTFDELHRAAGPDGPEQCLLEFRIRRRSDGAERWIALQGRRYPGGRGQAAEIVGTARDITSRKQRETHMHLLMREVTHRSKNLLAIIQAMARQTVKDSVTAAEFEQRFSARLRGLAASHDLLAARDWHGAAIGELVRWQLGPALETAGARIGIEGPDLYLNPEAAQNIGLAFNELASNATRFGALSGPEGRVDIAWSVDPEDGANRRFRISWAESGGPEVSQPRRTGFGHKVVERLTARALDGVVSLDFPATGLTWSLHIPASFVLDAADVPIVN
ncbi:sensor histidine kinase [Lichenibacterium dinghuense]|uniref:sensor histidine kinase n=1 Tax=Lichenibacterium dinghuense TaxID=2895977 RepID=UPI001F19ECC5|nr:sensor histidine kinase [Lichenibacterium sp. 6Y81]